jgi:hypothetical protein
MRMETRDLEDMDEESRAVDGTDGEAAASAAHVAEYRNGVEMTGNEETGEFDRFAGLSDGIEEDSEGKKNLLVSFHSQFSQTDRSVRKQTEPSRTLYASDSSLTILAATHAHTRSYTNWKMHFIPNHRSGYIGRVVIAVRNREEQRTCRETKNHFELQQWLEREDHAVARNLHSSLRLNKPFKSQTVALRVCEFDQPGPDACFLQAILCPDELLHLLPE